VIRFAPAAVLAAGVFFACGCSPVRTVSTEMVLRDHRTGEPLSTTVWVASTEMMLTTEGEQVTPYESHAARGQSAPDGLVQIAVPMSHPFLLRVLHPEGGIVERTFGDDVHEELHRGEPTAWMRVPVMDVDGTPAVDVMMRPASP
jgi:hypothetical protein